MKSFDNEKYIMQIYNNDYVKIIDAINQYNNAASKIVDNGVYAWDRICTCMDRLTDTVYYLNGYVLTYDENRRSAFDFYNYINCMYIIIDSIITLATIYNLDTTVLEKFKNENDIFDVETEEEYSDYEFFLYIRSLCAVHPFKTNKHVKFLDGAKLHCCPYVIWADERDRNSCNFNGELVVRIYNSNGGIDNFGYQLYLSIESFEKYLNKWLNFSNVIVKAINTFYNCEYNKWVDIKLKDECEFDDYIEYLKYLSKENEKRFNYHQEYIFNYYIKVFSVNMQDCKNNSYLKKYKNAIKLGIDYKRKSIQDMKTKGLEYTGISNPVGASDNSLFFELECPNLRGTEFEEYSYNIEKVYYLSDCEIAYSNSDKYFARSKLESIKDLINKYVNFTNNESDDEVFVLVMMAIYFSNLNIKSDLNNSIPHDEKYRI